MIVRKERKFLEKGKSQVLSLQKLAQTNSNKFPLIVNEVGSIIQTIEDSKSMEQH
jgi:hypothetical protein